LSCISILTTDIMKHLWYTILCLLTQAEIKWDTIKCVSLNAVQLGMAVKVLIDTYHDKEPHNIISKYGNKCGDILLKTFFNSIIYTY
jgi:hypothetical protein